MFSLPKYEKRSDQNSYESDDIIFPIISLLLLMLMFLTDAKGQLKP